MAVNNLRKYYYPAYTKDTFIEVPDDVADELEEGRRIENRQNSKRTYYLVRAHFSETSTETMEDKIKRMLRNEVRQMMEDE